MTTEKRIEIAARILAGAMAADSPIILFGDKAKAAREALAWADAIEAEATKGAKATRYDWSKAPASAMFAATDSDGDAYFWSGKPCATSKEWYSSMYEVVGCIKTMSSLDWRDSLEARP